jgi:hypothetical protein
MTDSSVARLAAVLFSSWGCEVVGMETVGANVVGLGDEVDELGSSPAIEAAVVAAFSFSFSVLSTPSKTPSSSTT